VRPDSQPRDRLDLLPPMSWGRPGFGRPETKHRSEMTAPEQGSELAQRKESARTRVVKTDFILLELWKGKTLVCVASPARPRGARQGGSRSVGRGGLNQRRFQSLYSISRSHLSDSSIGRLMRYRPSFASRKVVPVSSFVISSRTCFTVKTRVGSFESAVSTTW
jgi:hypothetical protein